jgi:hypothetical protein
MNGADRAALPRGRREPIDACLPLVLINTLMLIFDAGVLCVAELSKKESAFVRLRPDGRS